MNIVSKKKIFLNIKKKEGKNINKLEKMNSIFFPNPSFSIFFQGDAVLPELHLFPNPMFSMFFQGDEVLPELHLFSKSNVFNVFSRRWSSAELIFIYYFFFFL